MRQSPSGLLGQGLRGPLGQGLRGLLGQGLRFALAGGIVMLVYLLATLSLSNIVGLSFQVALALGFCLAIAVHFTLQRVFVWTSHGEFALPLRHQVGRYLLLAGAQYGVTVASTSLLAPLLGLPTEVVYLATVGLTVSTSFLIFRYRIFHATLSASACAPSAAVNTPTRRLRPRDRP